MADDPEIREGEPGPAESGALGSGVGSYAPSSDQPQDFDQVTRGMAGLASRRTVLGAAGAAILAAVVAWFVWGRGRGSECSTPSRCGDRHYCNEEQTCICTETAEGNLRCGQIPPYCNVPLCTTSADCAHLGEGWFCDTPNSGCCTDPPAELSRCIAPCGAVYPPPPTTTTTTTEPAEETEEPEEPQDDGGPAHLRRTASQEDGLLFFTRWEDGSGVYYFGEAGRADTLELTHVVFQGRDRRTASVIVNEDLLPVSWVAPRMSIAARSEARDTPLDPTDALHAVIIDAEESVHRIDLVPGDLAGVLGRSEALTGEGYRGARAALRGLPTDWQALVAAARRGGAEQPQRLANAVGLSIAHAGLALLEATGLLDPEPPTDGADLTDEGDQNPTDSGDDTSTAVEEGAAVAADADTVVPLRAGGARGNASMARSIPAQLPGGAVMGPLVETMVKSALLNMGAEALFAPTTPTDPTVPTVDLLLCQGATSWGAVCHYAFFDADDIMGCLDFCKTDLGCFTNICMPITLSVNDARGGW